MDKRFWPPIPLNSTILTPPHDSASNSPQTQWVAMVAQAVAMATMTSQNHGQAILTPYSPLCHRFNTVTWLSIKFPTNPVGSLWQQWRHKTMPSMTPYSPLWHKPSLWQHGRHVLSKNHGQAILTPYSPLCHRFNTITWLSIEFPTDPVGCHGGTSRRYGNMDVMFCPKTMAKRFWPPIPLCATVSTLSHDSASNSPQTQRVAMVAQAVAMATMTSQNHGQAILTPYSPLCHRFNTVTWLSIEFPTDPVGSHGGTSRRYGNMDVIKPWPSDFDPLFPFVPPFQHCHMTQHRIPHRPSG